MLKRRDKDFKMKAVALQSTAPYDFAQQPTFLYAAISNTSKNAYDLFAEKMLQLSNVANNPKYKYSNRRLASFQKNVCSENDDVGNNSYVCDNETPCSRQKLRQNVINNEYIQHRRLKQISSSGQIATISLQHWPNINGELVAAPATTMNVSFAEMSTAKVEFAYTLLSKESLFDTTANANRSHTVIPSAIKIGKPITITATIKTGLLSLLQNAFLMVALLLTVLTLQRVSGQYFLSIAATTAAATTTTITTEATSTIATKSRSMMTIVATREIETTITKAVKSTNVKNIFDISQLDNSNSRQPSNQSEPSTKNLKTQQSEQKQLKSYSNERTQLQQIQRLLKDFDGLADSHSSNLWKNSVGVLSSADTKNKYKFTSVSNEPESVRIDQKYTDSRRKILRNKSLKYAPANTASRSRVHKNTHHSHSAPMPKLQNPHKHRNGLIHFSKLIYNKSNKSKLFNVKRPEERQKKIKALQQRHRSMRSTVYSIVTQLKSNNTKLDINSSTNSESEQQYISNNHIYKGEASGNFDTMKSIDADESIDIAGIVGTDKTSNNITNKYEIKIPNAIEDSNGNEHNTNDQKLLKLVMDGLGLHQLPNMKKVNISQREYVTKYREYLRRMHERKRRELAETAYAIGNKAEWKLENVPLYIVSIVPNVTEYETYSRRKRNIQNFFEDFYPNKDGVTEVETVTDNFLLPRKQRNNDRKYRQKQKRRTTMILHFALETNGAPLQIDDVEEANIRLMLIHSSALAVKSNKKKQKSKNRPCGNSVEKSGKGHANFTAANNKQKHILNLKVYQRLGHGKRLWLDSSNVNIEIDQSRTDDTQSQWLQFDVTKAVKTWLREQRSNLGLEVQCDNCQRVGARILNDMSSPTNVDDLNADDTQLMPILNIIGRLGVSYKEIRSNKHSNYAELAHHYHNVATFSNGLQRLNGAIDKHSCQKVNQRCCRHTMEVVFKEIKGFEFIIQPKVFDAGYCHGRCPPRYNPAHHHAMLQSLIWNQNRERAPRPCCAPSKLVELEVLHVDEKDTEKLKISTWTDMRVVECACS